MGFHGWVVVKGSAELHRTPTHDRCSNFFEAQAHALLQLPVAERLSHFDTHVPKYCHNTLAPMPKVVFNVKWPSAAHENVQLECNERQTPGGDCYSLIAMYSPLIAWGTQYAEPFSASIVISTSSTLIRQMGQLDVDGFFSGKMLRALTLGAYTGTPLLGVKFILDDAASLAGAYGADFVAGLAYTVLRNADLPTEISFMFGDIDCTHENVGNRECTIPSCLRRYSARGADEDDFGLSEWRLRTTSDGRSCEDQSVTKAMQLYGARPIIEECGLTAPSLGITEFGFERSCMADPTGTNFADNSERMLCTVFIFLSALLGCLVSSLVFWMLTRQSGRLHEDLRKEVRFAFPQILEVAKAEDRDVREIVNRSISVLMIMEAALDGDLDEQFRNCLYPITL